MTKPFWQSKTLWFNAAIAGVIAVAQTVGAHIPIDILAVITPLANILLRLITTHALDLTED